MPGTTALATSSHATSNRLRSTGASHTAATFRRGRARFTQTGPDGRSTRHTSDDTPPPSGTIGGRSAPTRPSRRSDASSGAEARRRRRDGDGHDGGTRMRSWALRPATSTVALAGATGRGSGASPVAVSTCTSHDSPNSGAGRVNGSGS